MLQTTFFKPDTCDCQLLFQWDSDLQEPEHTPIESFTNQFGEVFNTFRCEDHQIEDVKELHQKAWHDENKRKNQTLTKVLEVLPEEKPKWYFDEQRNLIVEIQTKNRAIKDALNQDTPSNVIIK